MRIESSTANALSRMPLAQLLGEYHNESSAYPRDAIESALKMRPGLIQTTFLEIHASCRLSKRRASRETVPQVGERHALYHYCLTCNVPSAEYFE